jgi:hypothetical protein
MTGYVILLAVAIGLFGYIRLALNGRLGKRNEKIAREMVTWWRS